MAKSINAKKELVAKVAQNITERQTAEKTAFVFNYTQISSNEINNLRRNLVDKGTDVKVVKNTLIKRVLGSLGVSVDKFEGQNLLLIPSNDFITPLKDVFKFIKDTSKGSFKAGILNGQPMNAAQIESLSKLPSKEILLGQLVGVMNAPVRNFVFAINGVQSNFVRVLGAVRDKKQS